MNYWQRKPTDKEQELLAAVLEAHSRSAYRSNYSTETVIRHALASGSYLQAVAGAILSLGGVHAPLEQTYALLQRQNPEDAVDGHLEAGTKVPGWGNSFEKGGKDPLWLEVDKLLAAMNPTLCGRIEAVTRALVRNGKSIWPNPSCYTAAAAITLGIPAKLAPFLFIHGRLGAWSDLIERNTQTLWVQQ